jgi:hypothetical protein
MPIAKVRQEYAPTPDAAPAPQLSTELDNFQATPSPALALQQHLAQRAITAPAPNFEKWSARRSLALIVSASAALWMAILMAGAEATKLVA